MRLVCYALFSLLKYRRVFQTSSTSDILVNCLLIMFPAGTCHQIPLGISNNALTYDSYDTLGYDVPALQSSCRTAAIVRGKIVPPHLARVFPVPRWE